MYFNQFLSKCLHFYQNQIHKRSDSESMLLLTRNVQSYIIFECVNQFLILLSANDTNILVVNLDGHFHHPVTRLTYGHQINSFERIKPDIYVIKCEALDLRDVLHHLERNTFFNPRAQFLLIVKTIEDVISETLADFFIYKVVVMEESEDVVNLYSYQHYKEGRVVESPSRVHVGLCIGGNIKYVPVFHTIPKRRLPLRVGCSHSIPSMIFQDGIPTSGVDFELLKLISERLELQIQYTVVSDYVGRKDDRNHFFDGALGALAKREVDLVVGGVFRTWKGLSTFDFTHPTVVNDYAWIVPASTKRPLWKSLISTFSPTVWILYFYVFLMSLIILISADKLVALKFVKWFRELVMLYTTCLTSSGVNWKLELYCKKLVFISWLLMNFIYSVCFSAKLLSNLVIKKYENQMNLLDIATNNLKICIYTELIEKLNSFEEDRIVTCLNCERCVNRTAFKRDLISVRSSMYVEADIPKFYLNEEGEPLIFLLDSIFMITYDCMIFRKNHPLFAEFDKIIARLVNSGFVDKITQKYTKKDVNLRPVKWRKLSFEILFFVFRLFIYGLIIASLVLMFEVLLAKKQRQKMRLQITNLDISEKMITFGPSFKCSIDTRH